MARSQLSAEISSAVPQRTTVCPSLIGSSARVRCSVGPWFTARAEAQRSHLAGIGKAAPATGAPTN